MPYAWPKKGLIKPPFFFQFVLGAKGGIPATPENLMFMRNSIPEGAIWSAIGASKDQLMINTMTDSAWRTCSCRNGRCRLLPQGRTGKVNAQFVERIVELAKTLGREVATPDEAREIIGLKVKNATHA